WIQPLLSPQEIDIICGVYRVFKDPKRNPRQLSWWPKPTAWANSGLDVGYWSSECESWYQQRITDINQYAAQLRTSEQWK
ncbi:hypothetical protein M422DRAFT_127413, partial [Sphaerobolus stellatus SS14]